jgi:hypothetical protein
MTVLVTAPWLRAAEPTILDFHRHPFIILMAPTVEEASRQGSVQHQGIPSWAQLPWKNP